MTVINVDFTGAMPEVGDILEFEGLESLGEGCVTSITSARSHTITGKDRAQLIVYFGKIGQTLSLSLNAGLSPLDPLIPSDARQKEIDTASMTQTEYLAFIKEVFDEMYTLIEAKNSDYANSDDAFANFRVSTEFGVSEITGIAMRLSDKMQRLKSFCRKGELKVADEGIEDIFKDFIGYSLIALGIIRAPKRRQ